MSYTAAAAGIPRKYKMKYLYTVYAEGFFYFLFYILNYFNYYTEFRYDIVLQYMYIYIIYIIILHYTGVRHSGSFWIFRQPDNVGRTRPEIMTMRTYLPFSPRRIITGAVPNSVKYCCIIFDVQ